MTRIKTAGIAAGFALALVVGILAGGVMSTVSAEDGRPGVTTHGTTTVCPMGDAAALQACIDEYRASFAPDAADKSADSEDADAGDGDPETVQCSIVDGCTVEVVDAEGAVIKTMHITFTDVGDLEVSDE